MTIIKSKKAISEKVIEAFSRGEDGVLCYQSRLCVPNNDELRHHILVEISISLYFIHP